MYVRTAAADKPRLKRALGLWALVIYGIIMIQPTAPMSPYGVVCEAARGHVVTTVLMAMVAMLFTASGLAFIDTGFENASPPSYEFAADHSIQVHLLYDHERNSLNWAAGHFHFLLHAKSGSKLTLEFRNNENTFYCMPVVYVGECTARPRTSAVHGTIASILRR